MLMARAMLAGFLVWFDEPAESSLPHFVGAQFSWNGLSLTCAWTTAADNAKAKPAATAMIETFIISPSPDCFWMTAILRAGGQHQQHRLENVHSPYRSHSTPSRAGTPEHFTPLFVRGGNGRNVGGPAAPCCSQESVPPAV